MKSIVTFFILFAFFNWNAFSQLDTRNDWAAEKLKHTPSKVTESEFKLVEKFGEFVEQRIKLNELSFNHSGYYLSKHFSSSGNDHGIPRNELKSFSYEAGTNNLIEVVGHSGNKERFEYSSGLRTKRTIEGGMNIDVLTAIFAQEYKYDSQNRNILISNFDYWKKAILIWEYIYTGKLLSEAKVYNSEGTFMSSFKFQYDTNGNRTKSEEYVKKNLTECINYEYNEKNDVIKEQTLRINSYNSLPDQQKYYYWYKYDYYPNGVLKKSYKYSHNDLGGGAISDSPIEFFEYKYDEFGNWVEKNKMVYNIDYKKVIPSNKYIREIEYF